MTLTMVCLSFTVLDYFNFDITEFCNVFSAELNDYLLGFFFESVLSKIQDKYLLSCIYQILILLHYQNKIRQRFL